MASPATQEACEVSDFHSWRLSDLKRYLKELNQSVSGKKAELIKRVEGCIFLGLKKNKNVEIDNTVNTLVVVHFNKLETPAGQQLTEPASLKDWQPCDEMPADVKETDVYNYFILSRYQTTDNKQMGAARQLKGKTMFLEGHVHSIAYHSISDDCDHCFISGKVMPSLPSRDAVKTPDHLTWVCLSKVSGHVHSAHCSCTAGEGGSCNHVAAVMYATSNMCKNERMV